MRHDIDITANGFGGFFIVRVDGVIQCLLHRDRSCVAVGHLSVEHLRTVY